MVAGGSTSVKATTGPRKNAATAAIFYKKPKPRPTRVGSSAAAKRSARPSAGCRLTSLPDPSWPSALATNPAQLLSATPI
ncbi:hypothetical protein PCANC_03570 [Puccinia coronata f. sp. avenae]|uniref:Uncharacterized protein n=1 Tax=Puccinia coronata f. sp. avenae TaxID=200324 RepID=A0A2N5VUX9_9BASI|nr:hypothetical protein PCASD_22031 [Puccinia coronata f. sp. avenae]PLW53807.1 hypothetical protein PCANC_03570 [Puccinia coronata f. sp. avenae]